jgi:CMP-N-acetylneuraminic acid synthetase
MKILGIIPARKGSLGIKNKNLRTIGGKSLVQIAIDNAKKSAINYLVVTSNDERIIRIAKKNNIAFIKRPERLSLTNSKTIDVVLHAIKYLKKNKLYFDAIMLLQPTSPFRSFKDINNAISLLKKNNIYDSCISVEDVESFHPARMKFIKNNIELIDHKLSEKIENQPRQQLKSMYIRNGSIYLTKLKSILKKSFKGQKCLAYIMPKERSINIDSKFDLEIARLLNIYATKKKNINYRL